MSSPEDYALALGDRFLDAAPAATAAQIRVEEYAWDRIPVDGEPHDHSFVRRGTRHPYRGRHRRGPRRRPSGLGGLGTDRPDRAEVDGLGVQGLPQGPLHDAAGDRRPDHGHVADRAVALRRVGRRHRLERVVRRHPRDPAERFAATYSRALQETLYAMGSRGPRGSPRGRRDQVLGAQQAPLPLRPRAVRAREQRGGLPRSRPSLRPDRGGRDPRRRRRPRQAWTAVPGFA